MVQNYLMLTLLLIYCGFGAGISAAVAKGARNMSIDRSVFKPTAQQFFKDYDGWIANLRGTPNPDFLRAAIPEKDYKTNGERHKEAIAEARALLEKKLDRTLEWDMLSRQANSKIQSASYYYLVTAERKALDFALDGLEAIEACSRKTFNHSTFIGLLDVDLQTAGVVKSMAIMRCAFKPLLDATLDKRLQAVAIDRCLVPALDGMRIQGFWWTKAKHNWRSVMTGSLAMGAMAFCDVYKDWAEVVEYGIEGILTVIELGDQAGGWNEGPGYWEYGIVHCVEPAFFLKTSSKNKVDLLKHPYLKCTADFRAYMTVKPGQVWNWSDGAKTVEPSVCATILARVNQNQNWQAFIDKEGLKGMNMLYFYDPNLSSASAKPLALSKVFPDLGVVAMRSGFGPDDDFVGLKAGSVSDIINHCHLDLGSVVVFSGGEELLAETEPWPYAQDQKVESRKGGYFDFTPGGRRWNYDGNGGLGHNLLVIGSEYPRREKETEAKIVIQQFGTDRDLLMIDATPCYQPLALLMRRYVAYLRPGVLILVDELRSTEKVKAKVLYHFLEQASIEENAFTIKHGSSELIGHSLCPSHDHNVLLGIDNRTSLYNTEHEKVKMNNKFVYVENFHKDNRLVFVSTLTFGKKGAPHPHVSLSGDPLVQDSFTVQVVRGESKTQVSFDLSKGLLQ